MRSRLDGRSPWFIHFLQQRKEFAANDCNVSSFCFCSQFFLVHFALPFDLTSAGASGRGRTYIYIKYNGRAEEGASTKFFWDRQLDVVLHLKWHKRPHRGDLD